MLRFVTPFLITLCICTPTVVSAQTKLTKSKPIRIGMILTLSGSFATAGEDGRKGVEAALDVSGKRGKFEIIYADSQNEPTSAITEFRKLTKTENVPAVYTHRSSVGMALNPVSNSAKVPLLGGVGHTDFAATNMYAFQVWPKSDDEGAFVAETFIDEKFSRIAIISTEDEWTDPIARGFRNKLGESEIKPVFDQSVLLAERDFRTLLTKIKHLSADVIYLNLLLPQIGPAIKQAKELGVSTQLYSNFYTTRSDVLENAGKEALEGVRYVEMDTNLPALKKELGIPETASPQGLTVSAYIATMYLTQALEGMEGPANSAEIYDALLSQKEIKTPDHNFEVKDRVVQIPLMIKEMRDGKGQEQHAKFKCH